MKKYLLLFLIITITFNGKTQTVTDIEGNVYNVVTIGTQVWMKENMRTTKYNDGTPIPNITSFSEWLPTRTDAYCWNNFDMNTFKATYGALYNWYAAEKGNICPTGWHLPSYAEWDTLITNFGGTEVAGGKLKEAGTAHWYSTNDEVDNSSGFTGLPGGFLDPVNDPPNFHTAGYDAHWWSSSTHDTTEVWGISLAVFVESTHLHDFDKRYGLSVRCIKDKLETSANTYLRQSEISLHPNPAGDFIYLQHIEENTQIEIFNDQGILVNEIVTNSEDNSIDIRVLAPGFYFIKLYEKNRITTKKLIKK